MSLAIAYGMKKKMAKGGRVDKNEHVKGVHKPGSAGVGKSNAGSLAEVGKKLHDKGDRARVYGESHAGESATNSSKREHRRVLSEMKEESKRDRKNLAEGGEVCAVDCPGCPSCSDAPSSDIVKEIMMSRGGQVANDTESFNPDEEPNEFDDLVLRDDLEFSYDGENSGDNLGNEQKEDDERDMIAQIMRSRRKRDRLPSPA